MFRILQASVVLAITVIVVNETEAKPVASTGTAVSLPKEHDQPGQSDDRRQ